MKFKEIGNKLSRSTGKLGLKIKKHSPEIMIVAGIAGTVTATVMACKETTKLSAILDSHKDQVEKIHNAVEHPETLPEEYTAEDGKKDLTIVYSQTGIKVAKLYAPSVILGALSIGMIVASNNIMRKRYASLSAAYVTLDSTFKKYRQNVVDRFGTDVDHELRYSIKEHKVLDENGNETDEVIKTAEIEEYDTSVWFNGSPYYEADTDYNLYFLKGQQSIANDKLKAKGYLFLNDVYDMIGKEKTKAGQSLGWIYSPNDPDFNNFVDFGIYQYINGDAELESRNADILLGFNVDGNILDLMK